MIILRKANDKSVFREAIGEECIMLRFQYNPDIIFTKIISLACEEGIDYIVDADDFACSFPHASRNLSVNTAIEILKELKKKNEDYYLWELNDYHYCVIYDLLEYFCAVQNDLTKDSKEPILVVDKCKIYELDFNEIVEHYFFDEDFLLDRNLFLNMTEELKDQMGFSKETFGVIMGLKVHPDELKIKLFKKGKYIPVEPEEFLYEKGSKRYPSLA